MVQDNFSIKKCFDNPWLKLKKELIKSKVCNNFKLKVPSGNNENKDKEMNTTIKKILNKKNF